MSISTEIYMYFKYICISNANEGDGHVIRFWNALLAVGDNTGYEPCDSGKLISSRRRYEIWNMIRGSQSRVLDDMRHDSGKVSIAFYPYDR